MSYRVAVLMIAALALSGTSVSAQYEGDRRGFWLSFGGGGGVIRDLRAATFYVRMGGTPNSRLQFGGQVMNWWRDESHEESHTGVSVSATAAFFPWDDGEPGGSVLKQAFFRAGFGPVTMGSLSGVGPTFGTGIDLRLSGNLHVTPNLDTVIYFLADHTYASVAFTLGLTWH